jgi:hypothetical protein
MRSRFYGCFLPGLGFPFSAGFGFPFGFTGGFVAGFRPWRFPGLAGGAPLPNFVGAGRTGAGSGACDGSKQSDISSAVSSRVLMDWMPNNVWQNFKRLMCER